MKKKILIIGGGFAGLTAGLELQKSGYEVEVFEKDSKWGGLASGFKSADWKWSLEKYYHHIFTSDKEIINLSKEVGVKVDFYNPITASLVDGVEVKLDSPLSLLNFKKINFLSRLWMGLGLLILKLIPNGLFLESITAEKTLPILLGPEGYKEVWKKLLKSKFGGFSDKVNMAWFWSRVAKRSKSLGYFDGGFESLAEAVAKKIELLGGKAYLNREIKKMEKNDGRWFVDGKGYDAVLLTTPLPMASKILGEKYKFKKINYLWGQTVVLELTKSVLKSYWLNILDPGFNSLVAVEHTRMIDKKHYNNSTLLYLGNYLEEDDKKLRLNDEALLEKSIEDIRKINSDFKKEWIKRYWRFKSPYAQPVFGVNYSKNIPATRIENGLYIANMSMVYPYDRGTNYAVEIGRKVANQIKKEIN